MIWPFDVPLVCFVRTSSKEVAVVRRVGLELLWVGVLAGSLVGCGGGGAGSAGPPADQLPKADPSLVGKPDIPQNILPKKEDSVFGKKPLVIPTKK